MAIQRETAFSGDQVMPHNYAGTPQCLPGQVTAVAGPVLYQVTLTDGRLLEKTSGSVDQSNPYV